MTTELHFGDANDSTSHSSTGIASGGAQLVTTLAKVIRISVHHHSPANDAVLSREGNETVCDVDRGFSIVSSSQVAKITNMANFIRGPSVGLAQRIEMGSSTDTTWI